MLDVLKVHKKNEEQTCVFIRHLAFEVILEEEIEKK